MRCPLCLSANIEWKLAPISTEPHGETFTEEYFYCVACGSRFAESDLVTIPEIYVQLVPEVVSALDVACEGAD